jgi:hypothetical protein
MYKKYQDTPYSGKELRTRQERSPLLLVDGTRKEAAGVEQ